MSERQIWLTDNGAAVAEDFDDEIVIMHTKTGAFYSLRGRAADVWRSCAAGASVEQVAAALESQEVGEADLLSGMLAELQASGVLRVAAAGSAGGSGDAPVTLGTEPAEFSKNEDFNDLVRLDPIHDVDERGWPFN